jgi:hypothetical protein
MGNVVSCRPSKFELPPFSILLFEQEALRVMGLFSKNATLNSSLEEFLGHFFITDK